MDSDDDTAAVPARSFLPPAAALLDGSYAPPPAHTQRAVEAAALHQGRARAFPHVTGSYPTHVYIEGGRGLLACEELQCSVQGRMSGRRQLGCAPLPQTCRHRSLPPSPPCPHVAAPAPPSSQAALEAVLQLLSLRLPGLQPIVHSGGSGGGAVGAAPSGAGAAAPQALDTPAAAAGQLAQPWYHVSLSRTVPLRGEQIQPLVADLRRRLR